ncbi:MAG: methyltransferase domain-containing protein, partial [bacterium]|nr:methyltransferase domain-containing protein [bacterium]
GTVLLEALALGCRVIGSDNDAAAIAESRANIQWALGADAEQHDRVQLCVADVRELRSCVPAASVDAVVTEPSLGPVRWSGVRGQVSGVVHELHALYVAAFREFAKVLKSGGRAVFVVPVFRSGATEHAVDIIRDVERLGFRRVNPFPSALRAHAALHGREDLPYARQDQRVGRQILLFERT